jgi:hypothetical protein
MTAISVPNSLFQSVFKNISGRDLWVSFLPPWGRTVKPNEVFCMPGDPRYADDANAWPRQNTVVQRLMKEGLIEFLSSPGVILDNQKADGTSLTLTGSGDDFVVIPTTTPAVDVATRILPVIVPTVTYSAVTDQFTIDWEAATGLEPTDTFSVLALGPDGPDTVSAYRDKSITYNATAGAGDYTFTITLTAQDGRTQEGTPVTETVA